MCVYTCHASGPTCQQARQRRVNQRSLRVTCITAKKFAPCTFRPVVARIAALAKWPRHPRLRYRPLVLPRLPRQSMSLRDCPHPWRLLASLQWHRYRYLSYLSILWRLRQPFLRQSYARFEQRGDIISFCLKSVNIASTHDAKNFEYCIVTGA